MDVTSVRRVRQEDWTDEGVRFLRARDLVAFAKNEAIDDPLFISDEMYREYSAQSGKVVVGDLLVTGVGTIGVPWLVTSENPVYFKDGNIIWFKNQNAVDGEFFYHSFTAHAIQRYIKESAGIGTVGTYTIETGKKTPIWLPSEREQRQIAAFMTSLDTLITLHQRKCQYRSLFGYLSWEQRKLGDVATIVGGGTPSTNNDAYWDGDIDWYSPAELDEQVYADRSVRRITQAGYDSCSATLLPAGKTILFTSRAGIGNTAILRRPACTNQGFQSLVVNDDTDVYFVYSMTDRIKKFAEQKASGSTFLEISGKGLAAGEFAFPSKDEQNAIGSMFNQLDHLITLHQ